MRQNLDSTRAEMEDYLRKRSFAVFHGYSRALDTLPLVHWDVERHPSFEEFLEVAEKLGCQLVIFHQREFLPDHIEDAMERLEESDMPREDARNIARRLQEMRVYEGFLCVLELSFDYGGRAYLFTVQTDWHEELNDILDEIDAHTPDPTGSGDTASGFGGGYFSKN